MWAQRNPLQTRLFALYFLQIPRAVQLPETNRILQELFFIHTNDILKYCIQHGILHIDHLRDQQERLWLEELTKLDHVDRSNLTSAKDQLLGLSLEILANNRLMQLLRQQQQGCPRTDNRSCPCPGVAVVTPPLPCQTCVCTYGRTINGSHWIVWWCDSATRDGHHRGLSRSKPSRLRWGSKTTELFSLRWWVATSPAPVPVFGRRTGGSDTNTDAIDPIPGQVVEERAATISTEPSRGDVISC